MKYFKKINGWRLLFSALSMCALLGLLFGCSIFKQEDQAASTMGSKWLEDSRKKIEQTIDDPNKKAALLALLDDTEKDLGELQKMIEKFYADIGELNDNYNATPEDYQNVFTALEKDRNEIGNRLTDMRFKVVALTTPEEWQELPQVGELLIHTMQAPK